MSVYERYRQAYWGTRGALEKAEQARQALLAHAEDRAQAEQDRELKRALAAGEALHAMANDFEWRKVAKPEDVARLGELINQTTRHTLGLLGVPEEEMPDFEMPDVVGMRWALRTREAHDRLAKMEHLDADRLEEVLSKEVDAIIAEIGLDNLARIFNTAQQTRTLSEAEQRAMTPTGPPAEGVSGPRNVEPAPRAVAPLGLLATQTVDPLAPGLTVKERVIATLRPYAPLPLVPEEQQPVPGSDRTSGMVGERDPAIRLLPDGPGGGNPLRVRPLPGRPEDAGHLEYLSATAARPEEGSATQPAGPAEKPSTQPAGRPAPKLVPVRPAGKPSRPADLFGPVTDESVRRHAVDLVLLYPGLSDEQYRRGIEDRHGRVSREALPDLRKWAWEYLQKPLPVPSLKDYGRAGEFSEERLQWAVDALDADPSLMMDFKRFYAELPGAKDTPKANARDLWRYASDTTRAWLQRVWNGPRLQDPNKRYQVQQLGRDHPDWTRKQRGEEAKRRGWSPEAFDAAWFGYGPKTGPQQQGGERVPNLRPIKGDVGVLATLREVPNVDLAPPPPEASGRPVTTGVRARAFVEGIGRGIEALFPTLAGSALALESYPMEVISPKTAERMRGAAELAFDWSESIMRGGQAAADVRAEPTKPGKTYYIPSNIPLIGGQDLQVPSLQGATAILTDIAPDVAREAAAFLFGAKAAEATEGLASADDIAQFIARRTATWSPQARLTAAKAILNAGPKNLGFMLGSGGVTGDPKQDALNIAVGAVLFGLVGGTSEYARFIKVEGKQQVAVEAARGNAEARQAAHYEARVEEARGAGRAGRATSPPGPRGGPKPWQVPLAEYAEEHRRAGLSGDPRAAHEAAVREGVGLEELAKGSRVYAGWLEDYPKLAEEFPAEAELYREAIAWHEKARGQRGVLDGVGRELESRHDVQWVGDTKSVESTVEKVARERRRDPRYGLPEVNDHVRGSIIVPDWETYAAVVEDLFARGYRIREWLDRPMPSGYRGTHATFSMGDGINAEIQVHVEASREISRAEHGSYEEDRKWRYVPREEIPADVWDRLWAARLATGEKCSDVYRAMPEPIRRRIAALAKASAQRERGARRGP